MLYSISEAVSKLTQLDPAFEAVYRRVAAQSAPDPPPITVVFAFYGRDVARAAARGLELASVLNLVESFMQDGAQDVKDAVATGFWEAVLAEASAGRLDFRLIAPHAGPASLAFCRAWDTFTGMRTPGLYGLGPAGNA